MGGTLCGCGEERRFRGRVREPRARTFRQVGEERLTLTAAASDVVEAMHVSRATVGEVMMHEPWYGWQRVLEMRR